MSEAFFKLCWKASNERGLTYRRLTSDSNRWRPLPWQAKKAGAAKKGGKIFDRGTSWWPPCPSIASIRFQAKIALRRLGQKHPLFMFALKKTLQELRMLSIVTLNCNVANKQREYVLNLAQLSLKFPKMMRMSLSRNPSSWPVSSSLKLWLRMT